LDVSRITLGKIKLHRESQGRARGSEFVIRLPLTSAAIDPGTEDETIQMNGKKLFVVEDNPSIRKMLALAMEINGFDVAVASDGLEALRIFAEVDPDIAVIDIGLPGLNGCELARRLRKTAEFDDVLLVAVTGYGQKSDRKRALSAGFDLHLVKPLDPDELVRAIAAHYAPTG